MKIFNKAATVALMAVLAVSAWAADVTGKWTAELPGRDGEKRTTTFDLKADGGKLTGTVSGMRGNPAEISDGKIDGSNVSFKVVREFNGNSMTINYEGTLSGDDLNLTVKTPRGEQKVTAKRAS
jgi:hypothetical protein